MRVHPVKTPGSPASDVPWTDARTAKGHEAHTEQRRRQGEALKADRCNPSLRPTVSISYNTTDNTRDTGDGKMNTDADVIARMAPPTTSIRRDSRNDKLERLHRVLGSGNYRQIAKLISRDHRHITRVLGGVSPRPSARVIEEIADAAHVPVQDVMWYVRKMQNIRQEKQAQGGSIVAVAVG